MTGSSEKRTDWRAALGLGAVALGWLAVAHVLPKVVWRAIPEPVLATMSYPLYGMICQILTLGAGIGLSACVLPRPASLLGAVRPTLFACAATALVAPAVFVAASAIAIKVAEPFLVAELATRGHRAVGQDAGALGRAVKEAPLFVALVWGALFAAANEEALFRGALYSAVRAVIARLFPRRASGDDRSSGVFAIVVAAAVFGWMHADMPGSAGIVRGSCPLLASGSPAALPGRLPARFWPRC
jgi:membrane protease YdiL (CAAX protease family)